MCFCLDLLSIINYKNVKQESKYYKCVKEFFSDDVKFCEWIIKVD